MVVDECFCHAAIVTPLLSQSRCVAASPRRHAREERMERWSDVADDSRAAHARRADRARRDERAQRPLLTTPAASCRRRSAAAARATTAPTTSPGSSWCASCRATASRCRRSRGTSTAIPDDATPVRHRAAPLAARPGHRGPRRRRARRTVRAWASPPRRPRPSPRCTPSTAGRSPTSSPRSSAPWCGRSSATPAARAEQLREFVHRLKPLTIAGLVDGLRAGHRREPGGVRRQGVRARRPRPPAPGSSSGGGGPSRPAPRAPARPVAS